jgi:hypothetical protein
MKMKKLKLTSSLNLKKCSKAKARTATLPLTLLVLGMFLCIEPPLEAKSDQHLLQELKTDLQKQHGVSFEKLVKSWEEKYGTQAFQPLLQIAADRKLQDTQRYVALMSATKMGGSQTVPVILPFLKDPSWMIRAAALRLLGHFNAKSSGPQILPLLRDPALVVRSEAVEVIQTLKPEGAALALVSALENNENYHAGKALWVPQKALTALVSLQATEATPALTKLLTNPALQRDLAFRKQLHQALSVLSKGSPQ